MRRFLCFSLCLGLMVSACKKKSVEESVNKAIAKAGGGAGSGSGGGDGGGGGTTVTKKDKAAVLKACLPEINAKMIELWANDDPEGIFLRRSTVWETTADVPLVVLYTGHFMPLEFSNQHGLGEDAATVTENLNAMAADADIQGQFVARADNTSGWRVHISLANTNVEIPHSGIEEAPEAPDADTGIIIYDRVNTIDHVSQGRTPRILARDNLEQANNPGYVGGWFDCVVDDKTQAVTFKYTETNLT